MGLLGPLRVAVFLLALIWPMTQAEMERALSIGRAFDAERARFHKPYMLAIADPTVEQIEVVAGTLVEHAYRLANVKIKNRGSQDYVTIATYALSYEPSPETGRS